MKGIQAFSKPDGGPVNEVVRGLLDFLGPLIDHEWKTLPPDIAVSFESNWDQIVQAAQPYLLYLAQDQVTSERRVYKMPAYRDPNGFDRWLQWENQLEDGEFQRVLPSPL
ncbi:MAG: hypothetical protein WD187_04580 [Candidatus Woykebacteria bacterium]